MTRKKSGFWTFVLSFVPGAGEMYMGFYKQGISLMAAFWGTVAVSGFLNLDFLICLLPIIWFYSFFHTHNLAGMPDEEFYAIEDDFLFGLENDRVQTVFSGTKGKKIIAAILIILGASALWKNLGRMLYHGFENIFPGAADIVSEFFDRAPEMVVAICLILVGIYMIRGKKKELSEGGNQNGEQ